MILSAVVSAAAIAAAPAPPQSLQATFDAATKAGEEGRCAEAVAAFDTLSANPKIARNPTAAAAVAVRRGLCLTQLSRKDEAEASLRAGVDTLARNPDSFADEAYNAYSVLAGLSADRLDYASGLADARKALAVAKGTNRARALFLVANFTRFDRDGEAVRASAEGLKLVESDPKASKALLASAQTYAARALMAADRVSEANGLLKRALSNNGGLTERTSIADVATRYDLAQAALLLKRMSDAKLYLAYTGAGRSKDTPFASAEKIDLPPCGLTPGMTPDSYAVVEFSLGEDGRVTRVEPIYAKGDRETALAFARAVREWSWSPQAAATIPSFYRLMTRVEVRCSNSAGAAGAAGVMTSLDQAAAAWIEGRGGASDAGSDVPAADWRARTAGSDIRALDANRFIATAYVGTPSEQRTAATRFADLARTLGAPQPVLTRAAIAVVDTSGPEILSRATMEREAARRRAGYQALLATPAVASDPIGAATLRLALAQLLRQKKAAAQETDTLLAQVADARDLPDRHPLKVTALLARANAAAATGDLATAARYFAATGLDEQQCALIGPKPSMKKSGASSDLFPMDLVQMGFEGWTRVEYDIGADGRTTRQRTLIAYPPFLFGEAARAMVAKTIFEPSYRPSNGAACSANQQGFVFRLPG